MTYKIFILSSKKLPWRLFSLILFLRLSFLFFHRVPHDQLTDLWFSSRCYHLGFHIMLTGMGLWFYWWLCFLPCRFFRAFADMGPILFYFWFTVLHFANIWERMIIYGCPPESSKKFFLNNFGRHSPLSHPTFPQKYQISCFAYSLW